MTINKLAILMTSFNRRELTLKSLASLYAQEDVEGREFTVFLVDDGSKDGTSAAVSDQFPQVRLLQGDGSLFWNGGMRKAFAAAIEVGFDAYIWFNDDTLLLPNALSRLLDCAEASSTDSSPAIIVASVCDVPAGGHAYGGFTKRTNGPRVDFFPLIPSETEPLVADTMNGNFTLIPAALVARLGNLDATFRHQIGDMDYGLRATASGARVLVAPGYFGTCATNPQTGTWRDLSQPFSKRWKNLMSPKGAPPREWLLYTRRHFGWRWPLYAASPYLKTLFGVR